MLLCLSLLWLKQIKCLGWLLNNFSLKHSSLPAVDNWLLNFNKGLFSSIPISIIYTVLLTTNSQKRDAYFLTSAPLPRYGLLFELIYLW